MAAAEARAGQGGSPPEALSRHSAVIVLAAGAGSRMGGVAKALLPIAAAEPGAAEHTYLSRIAATAVAARVGFSVAVVGPPHRTAVAAAASALHLEVIDNPEPERGMASSVALGFAWAAAHRFPLGAGLLWPCDYPAVSPATVRALFVAFLGSPQGTAAVIPTVDGRGGHPVLVSASLFAALADCAAAPEGARSVLRTAQVLRFPVEDRACVLDVDTPADAAALRALIAPEEAR
jgi:CTP:molybdopterin cytidylyltransferase MocA